MHISESKNADFGGGTGREVLALAKEQQGHSDGLIKSFLAVDGYPASKHHRQSLTRFSAAPPGFLEGGGPTTNAAESIEDQPHSRLARLWNSLNSVTDPPDPSARSIPGTTLLAERQTSRGEGRHHVNQVLALRADCPAWRAR